MYIRHPPSPSMQSWAAHLEITTCIHISYPTLHGRGKGGLDIKEFLCRGHGPWHVNAVKQWTQTRKRVRNFIYVLSGWLFFSQTPDSNFKMISIHLLQQQEKFLAISYIGLFRNFWKMSQDGCVSFLKCKCGGSRGIVFNRLLDLSSQPM